MDNIVCCAIVLQDISKKSKETAAQLEEGEGLAQQLEEEKKTLEEATSHLKGDLMVSVNRSSLQFSQVCYCRKYIF